MREQKLRGIEKAELQLMTNQMSIREWEAWMFKNNCNIIIEDGKVTGIEVKAKTYK